MFVLLSFVASAAIAVVAFIQSRNFVTRRLRYVGAVQTPIAPFVAGIGAALVATPFVAIIPFLGIGTALSFGFAVGSGVLAGARAVRTTLPRF